MQNSKTPHLLKIALRTRSWSEAKKNWKLKTASKAGYTFIEMLVSIAIFSGLLIIVLGVVATTSGSSARVNILRDKNQAARALIDQVSGDFGFVDTKAVFADQRVTPCNSVSGSTCLYDGFSIDRTRLVLALNLSGDLHPTTWVKKEYNIETFGPSGHQTLTLIESRNCKIIQPPAINAYSWDCGSTPQQSGKTDLLSKAYTLDDSSAFGGKTVYAGQLPPPFTPYLTLTMAIKPSDNSIACNLADPGVCYKVSTTLDLGSSH